MNTCSSEMTFSVTWFSSLGSFVVVIVVVVVVIVRVPINTLVDSANC